MTKKPVNICVFFAKKEKIKTLKNRRSAYLSIIMDCTIISALMQNVNSLFYKIKNIFHFIIIDKQSAI